MTPQTSLPAENRELLFKIYDAILSKAIEVRLMRDVLRLFSALCYEPCVPCLSL
jgi:hypothetical protein